MKKSVLALALLSAIAGSANAQSNVTVYGLIDAGVVLDRANSSKVGLGSGNQSGSRLGFRGSEDLGGGLSAVFNVENGFATDTGAAVQGGLLFGRRATVGLTGAFGALNAGRRNTPYFSAMDAVDPMNVGFAGNATNIFANTGIRMNNALIYTSPTSNPIVGELAYGFGERAGDNTADRQVGASLSYNAAPLFLILAHHSIDNATATGRERHTMVGGKFDFGVAVAHLAFADNSGIVANTGANLDTRDLMVGASLPLAGGHKIIASYIRKDDRSPLNADVKQAALAYTYDLSARTNLYVSWAKISNDPGATLRTNAGFGDREANFGIRHKF